MPANTYTLIEKIVVGAAGASSITFTSIPQTYTDLKVVISVRDATNNNGVVKITFNGSATGYTARQLYGTGSVAASNTDYTGSGTYYGTEGSSAPSNATASTFSSCEFYIPNYTSSNNKSISADSLYENNASLAYQSLSAGLWSNSAAITSITVTQFSGNNFAQYSTAYLYGIAKEGVSPSPSSAPYATGGDRIVFDGTYWIHTFTSSGTFTPQKSLSNVDYLVVAGGGPGGLTYGAGGGAGGLRSTVTATGGGGSLESKISFANGTAYTVTVGAGGTRSTAKATRGTNGSDSSISGTGITTITSTGGGAGANGSDVGTGATGGSGGGGGFGNNGAAGTANQGYAGGNSSNQAPNYGTGGGGGAGAVGSNGTSTAGGNGGNGVATSISGSSVTYAGGGGGGVYGTGGTAGNGGTGGGGNAGATSGTAGTAGTANTGGGGGGATGGQDTTYGGNGGSGIVIIRYAA